MQSARCIIRRQAICTSSQSLSSSTISPVLVRCIHTTSPSRQQAEEERPEKLTTVEKLRRKIWGTDAPPGAANPYEGRSQLEQQGEEDGQLSAPDQDSYIPDTDARNMMKVGTRGNFMQRTWDAKHPVKVYTTMEPGTSKENLEDLTQEIVISEFKKNIRAFQKNLASQKSNEGEMNEGSLASIYPPGEFNVLKIVKKRTGEEDKSSYPLEKYIERRGEKAVPKLWKDLPITNHVLKFAIMKRLREATGFIIPDPVVSAILTPRDILIYLHKPQPIKDFSKASLATKLTDKDSPIKLDLSKVQNVTIHPHRVRPSDRERAIGRTASIAIIEAGKLRQRGDDKKKMFLKRRRLLGLGIHSIDTVPEHRRTWSDWKEMMKRDAAIVNRQTVAETVEEAEDV